MIQYLANSNKTHKNKNSVKNNILIKNTIVIFNQNDIIELKIKI